MKNFIILGLVALGLLAIGCSENQLDSNLNEAYGEGIALMYISIQGSNTSTRAVDTGNDLYEDDVNSFAAYVFHNATKLLEKMEVFSDTTAGVIEDLDASFQKHVVVLVNYPGTYPNVQEYDDLMDVGAVMLQLDTQDPDQIVTNGLFMSGEKSGITLTEGDDNEVDVNVDRVVAKVRLASLVIIPDTLYSIDKFTLEGVSVQLVRNTTDINGALLDALLFDYVGGYKLASSVEIGIDYLDEVVNLPTPFVEGVNIVEGAYPYFYVFPNDITDGSATLISIRGTYDSKEIFYNFEINNEISTTPESTTDGTGINRNTIYDLYVTLENIALGSDDPDSASKLVTATIVVGITDWYGPINQFVTW